MSNSSTNDESLNPSVYYGVPGLGHGFYTHYLTDSLQSCRKKRRASLPLWPAKAHTAHTLTLQHMQVYAGHAGLHYMPLSAICKYWSNIKGFTVSQNDCRLERDLTGRWMLGTPDLPEATGHLLLCGDKEGSPLLCTSITTQ